MSEDSEAHRKLDVWLVKEGEPLPLDSRARLMRTGLLAKELQRLGHSVKWWTSDFSHAEKRRYDVGTDDVQISSGLTLVMLRARRGYKRNVSLSRLIYHQDLARLFARRAAHFQKPDIIVCSYPSVDLAYEAVKYGREHNIPVLLDIRDYWPDIFARALPPAFSRLAKLAIGILDIRAKWALRNASGLLAITPAALEWAATKANITIDDTHKVVPLGAEVPTVANFDRIESLAYWKSLGITEDTWNICFFGTFSTSSMDLDTCVKAVDLLREKNRNIRLVLCGSGDARDDLLRNADPSYIIAPGWVDAPKLRTLMSLSKIGLYPLRNLPDFRDTISNKFIEYLSGGLPIVTSLEGAAKRYVEEYALSFAYDEGSPRSLACKLELMFDEEERKAMATRSLQRFKSEFDIKITNRSIIEHLYKFIHVN